VDGWSLGSALGLVALRAEEGEGEVDALALTDPAFGLGLRPALQEVGFALGEPSGQESLLRGMVVPRREGAVLPNSQAIGPCLGAPPGNTNGTITFTGNGQLSCTTGNGRIDWKNDQTSSSTFDFTATVGVRPAGDSILVLTGEIKSGDFRGSTIIIEIILAAAPTQSLECLTPDGLDTSSGAVNLQIL
jgi:hypothetical protein